LSLKYLDRRKRRGYDASPRLTVYEMPTAHSDVFRVPYPRKVLNQDFRFGLLPPWILRPTASVGAVSFHFFSISSPSDSGSPGTGQLCRLRAQKNREVHAKSMVAYLYLYRG
jgi:hypothetical protein